MKRIYLLCLMLCLTACGAETDTSLGMLNQPPSITMKEHERYRYQVKLQNASDDAVITINNLPSWAEFDPEESVISGVPGHDNADGEYTFSISADDGEETFKSNDVTISVVHSSLRILSTPTARSLLKELSSFTQAISVESDLNTLLFSLQGAPDWMDINTSTGAISGTPSHADVGQTYSITVVVSDGDHEQRQTPFELTVTPLINLNPVVSVTTNASGDFYVNQDISFTFDSEITDITSITVAAPNGACISNIQISDDDFSTCISLDPLYPSPVYNYPDNDDTISEEANQKIKDEEKLRAENEAKKSNQILLSSAKLEMNKIYKIKVTTFVNEGFDYSIPTDFESSFYTISGLVITEVGSRLNFYDMHWFEVYNASRSEINLQDYTVRTRAIDSQGCAITGGSLCNFYYEHGFSLNDKKIQPGQYLVIRGNDWLEPYLDSERTTYIGSGVYPYWDDYGYIELIHNERMETEDYVSFGNWLGKGWNHIPVTQEAWGEQSYSFPPPVYNSNSVYTGSIGRNGGLSDSNLNSDWQVYQVHTAGGANDITDAGTDQDQDGIPDYAEVEGATYGGMSLYALGARVGRQDIFIEMDYMVSDDEGVIPQKEALRKVVDAFANQNIAVHFDVGDLFHQSAGISPEDYDLGGGNFVPFSLGVTFGANVIDTRADVYEIKRNNMSNARLPIFHYMLMAYSQQVDGSTGAGGFAEFSGNDAVVTLGGWDLTSESESSFNTLINIQSSVIMHELGHNLGLKHGGHEDINYKPNYVSIMNYLYSIEGLPTIGDNEGDRYYHEKNLREGDGTCPSGMTNPVYGDYNDYIIDYSYSNVSLDEASITEANGLNMQGSSSIDYNCDNDTEDTLANFDVNFSGHSTELVQSSDWDRINLKFQTFIWGNLGVSRHVRQPYDLKLIQDVVGDDISEVVHEDPPSKAIIDRIKAMK